LDTYSRHTRVHRRNIALEDGAVNLPPGLANWAEPFPGAPTVRYLERPVPVFVDVL